MKTFYSEKLSCYAADTAGICSALFELGGMTVVHDASGCNSTYATHDEPRWFNSDSMTYISAVTENDLVCGNDQKLIDDCVRTARELKPEFIALCNSPIPLMVGCDMQAIACEIEQACSIPCFAVRSSGMEHYWKGASDAWKLLAERFLPDAPVQVVKRGVNILGATPLDFSLNGNVEAISAFLEKHDFQVLASWAMNSTLEDLQNSCNAAVNLVIANSGLALAEYMFEKYHIPFVCGVPIGEKVSAELALELEKALCLRENSYFAALRGSRADVACVIVGESVYSGSLARALSGECGFDCMVIDPLEGAAELRAAGDVCAGQECDLAEYFERAQCIVADNMYEVIVPEGKKMLKLPHEAFSGRCYHKARLNLIDRKINWESYICRK